MNLKSLALQILGAKPEIKPPLKKQEKGAKLLPFKKTEKFSASQRAKHGYEWIEDHLEELKRAGYTDDDLYSLRLPKGLATAQVWTKPGLKVELNAAGTITFSWTNPTGQTIRQTQRPSSRPTLYEVWL